MPLTDKQAQNLDSLPLSDKLEILDYCLNEALGMMTVKDYIEMSGEKKSTVYFKIKNKQLTTHLICGIIFIVMNDK